MGMKATRKITEALSELLEGFTNLQDALEEELGDENSFDELESSEIERDDLESSLVTEVRAALELVMESDDYQADDIAALITSLTEALEEIDPSIFEPEDEELEDEDDYIVSGVDDDIDDDLDNDSDYDDLLDDDDDYDDYDDLDD